MKYCKYCDKTKPFGDFHKRSASADGLSFKCKSCQSLYQKENRSRLTELQRERRKKDPEYTRNWYYENVGYWKQYYEDNKDYVSLRNSEWAKNNPDKVRAKYAKRRATKLKATPSWLSEEHLQEMKNTYSHARDCEILTGDPYHVDHIVPLQGKNVCGLHVPWNLQVLPADINQSKSNRHAT